MKKDKKVVGFSGGAQSSFLAKQIVEKYGKENVILLFHDTKSEPADNYRFRKQFADFLELPITERSDGRDIWQICDDTKWLSNSRTRKCSTLLKHEQANKFYQELDSQGIKFQICIGFDKSEYLRRQRVVARNPEREFIFLDTKLSKEALKQTIVKDWGICLPEMYQHYDRANCLPCFVGGKANWFTIYKYNRPEFKKAQEYEEKFGHTFNSDFSLTEIETEFSWKLQQGEFFSEADFLPCECAF